MFIALLQQLREGLISSGPIMGAYYEDSCRSGYGFATSYDRKLEFIPDIIDNRATNVCRMTKSVMSEPPSPTQYSYAASELTWVLSYTSALTKYVETHRYVQIMELAS